MNWWDRLAATKEALVKELSRRGIKERYLVFGGEGEPPAKKPTVPTDARSEFLANRAMGDWAEDALARAVRNARPDWQVCMYGNAQRIAVGEPGFKEFYLSILEDVRLFGKRPDLLILSKDAAVPDDISAAPTPAVEKLVRNSIAGIEVRSSKFEALKYMAVRKEERAAGERGGRECPSFTVKVEDLRIVYRWLERYRKPQTYCQVFFDSVFAVNFLDIFAIVASGKGFQIETPAKSQEKATIMIPITSGVQVGHFTSLPQFKASVRVTRLGRHDAYVVPTGGCLEVDGRLLEQVLLP